ncbi:MAG: hypothetical protein IJ272_10735 [Clostridia bacterium]|nr:hypothetical protein [Clostridia bacterium]
MLIKGSEFMYPIGSIGYMNSIRPSSLTPISSVVPPVTRVPEIRRNDVSIQTIPTTKNTDKPFEATLNKYLARYEGQTQIDYAGSNNTPYDKALKELEESIVTGMNIDIEV